MRCPYPLQMGTGAAKEGTDFMCGGQPGASRPHAGGGDSLACTAQLLVLAGLWLYLATREAGVDVVVEGMAEKEVSGDAVASHFRPLSRVGL